MGGFVRIEQPVQMDDEIAHLRVVDGLLRLAPPSRIGGGVIRVEADDIDLFEINEAFASVPMAWQTDLDIDPEKVNVLGGAIALGHPLGATGARIMTTLIHQLRRSGKQLGLQTICEGGGMANATIVEAV